MIGSVSHSSSFGLSRYDSLIQEKSNLTATQVYGFSNSVGLSQYGLNRGLGMAFQFCNLDQSAASNLNTSLLHSELPEKFRQRIAFQTNM